MRILHIHKYYHDHDGASRYMLDLMHLQEMAGHTVAPFAMHDPRNKPTAWDKYFVSSLDTSRVRFGLGGLRQLARAFWSKEAKQKMESMLDVFRPDVVHVHNIYTHLSPSVLAPCNKRGIPVVFTPHDYALVSANYALWDGESVVPPEEVSLMRIAKTRFIKGSFSATFLLELIYQFHRRMRWYDRAIDAYLPTSTFMQKALVTAGYPKAKMHVIPLFAGNLLHDAPDYPPEELPRAGVLFAGRLEQYKGIDLFLEAAEEFPEQDFFVAGTGPLDELVRDAAQRFLNLHILGFLPGRELAERMASASLVVVPSRWYEPFGLVALEAMACGTPVLVSDAGGLPEKVKDGVTGYVFRAGDKRDFFKKLKLALEDERVLRRMGEGAYRYAKVNADPERHAAKIIEVYESVVIHR